MNFFFHINVIFSVLFLSSNTYAQNAFVQPGASNITFSGDSVTITGNEKFIASFSTLGDGS